MLISAKEIISRSLDLFKRDIRVWTPYVLLAFLFSLLSLVFTFGTMLWAFLVNMGLSVIVIFILTAISFLILIVLGMWVNVGLVRVIHKKIKNQTLGDMKAELGESRHFLGKSIGVSLLVALIAGLPFLVAMVGYAVTGFVVLSSSIKGGSLALMLFGLIGIYGIFHMIYFSIKFSFSYYAVILDSKHIREGLHVSASLMKARMGQVFWRLIAPVFVFVLIYMLVNYILISLASIIGGTGALIIANILSLAVSAFISPLTVLATVILYEDLKANPMPIEAKKA